MTDQDVGWPRAIQSIRAISRRDVLRSGARLIVGGSFAAALGRATIGVAFAQSTPDAELPYPELNVTTSDEGFQAPTSITAGRSLVTLHNTGGQDNAAHIMQAPIGSTLDEFIDQMNAMIAEAFATPSGGGTPETNASDEGPPLIFNQIQWFGGVDDTAAGRTAQAIVDLAPGDYALFNPNYVGTDADPFARLTVASDTPAAATPKPPADATVEEREFAYVGVPAKVAPGRHIWQVTNAGATPHEMYVAKVPDGTTLEQVMQAQTQQETPTPGQLDASQIVSIGGMGGLSPAKSGWAVFDFAPGTYVAFCYFPAPGTGVPHIMMGMATIFNVD